jgi:YgjP-like, metallopeptidase domain
MDAVEVRRSPRARLWTLEAPWGEPARLTVPQTSRAEVERTLAEKRTWIEEQRRRQLPRLGLDRLAVSESEARIAARELVTVLAEEQAERVGVAYQRIRIGGQRTLWGSCSARGTLSFNWRARAARGARLRGRARALPPARSEPLDAFLGARRAPPPALAPSARLAAPAWSRTSGLSSVELGRAASEQREAVDARASCHDDQPLSFSASSDLYRDMRRPPA